MDRLTFEGNFCDIAQCNAAVCPCGGSCTQKKVWERLKQYEDTGLEPEQVLELKSFTQGGIHKVDDGWKHVQDLLQAEQAGRLVVLPVKTVFELVWDAGPDCDLVCPVSIDGHGCCDFCDKGELCIYERKCLQEHIEQIGKTVFLTREEAEAALKGGEG